MKRTRSSAAKRTKPLNRSHLLESAVLTPFFDIEMLLSLRLTCHKLKKLVIDSHGPDKMFLRPVHTVFYKPTCFAIQVNALQSLELSKEKSVIFLLHRFKIITRDHDEMLFLNTKYVLCMPWCHRTLFESMQNGFLKSVPNAEVLHFQETTSETTQLAKSLKILDDNEIADAPKCHTLVLINSPLTTKINLPELTHFVCKLPWKQFISSLKNMREVAKLDTVIFFYRHNHVMDLEKEDICFPQVKLVVYNALSEESRSHPLKLIFPNARFICSPLVRNRQNNLLRNMQKHIDEFFNRRSPVMFRDLTEFWRNMIFR